MKIFLFFLLTISILKDFSSPIIEEDINQSVSHLSVDNDCDSDHDNDKHNEDSHCNDSCHLGHVHLAVFYSSGTKNEKTLVPRQDNLQFYILFSSEEYSLSILRPPIFKS